jgi:hemerythrin superfamily protein
MEEKLPQSIQIEHEEFHEQLAKAMKAGGKTAEAAVGVMKVLQPHMAREEELVSPALALLAPVAAGKIRPEMASFLPKAAAFKEELPRMLEQHGRIVEALQTLMQAAIQEQQSGFARLAQKLILHAQGEEEVLYPAAILVGEMLKIRLGKP